MARVFDDWGYRRYEWKCNSLNAPSMAAAVRLGFTFERSFTAMPWWSRAATEILRGSDH